jgi:hypothetical protein
MQSTANLHPFESLEFRYRRRAKYHQAAPERWSIASRDQAPEPRIPLWQTCLLAGGSSLFLWGLIGSVVWQLIG